MATSGVSCGSLDIRALAVRAIRERGYSPELIAEVYGISRSSLYEWLKRYDEGGYEALETRKAPGAAAVVSDAMAGWLDDVVTDATPQAFGYATALWTCAIPKRYGSSRSSNCPRPAMPRYRAEKCPLIKLTDDTTPRAT